MMPRMLVGSSSAPTVGRSASEAASSSRNSGLPSRLGGERAGPIAHLLQAVQVEQSRRQVGGLRVAQRLERQPAVRGEPAGPRRTAREELRPRDREEEHGHVARTRDERLDQIQQARVGPVDVLEHQHRRLPLAEPLHEQSGREEQRLPVGRRPAVGAQAEQHGQVRRGLLDVVARRQLAQGRQELPLRHVHLVVVEDAGDLLHVLGERAVGPRPRVAHRPAEEHPAARGLDALGQLVGQPRLPDAGRPEDGHEVRLALLDDPLPQFPERRELAPAADHRHARERALPHLGERRRREPRPDRLALPLRDDRLGRLVADHGPRRRVRLLADEHPVDRSRRLQARRGVDDVAGDHRLAEVRPRGQRDDRLAGVDGEARLQIQRGIVGVHLLEGIAHGQRRADGALGIVAVRDRRPEDAHHRVADELLHDAPVALHLGASAVVVAGQDRADVLGIEALRPRGEPHQVDEQDRDDATFLGGGSGGFERRPAGLAEAGPLGVLLPAGGADDHAGSLAGYRRRAGSGPEEGSRCPRTRWWSCSSRR